MGLFIGGPEMTILNMTYCVRCGKHHATTKGCNVDDVRKHKKEMEKYRAKGKLVEYIKNEEIKAERSIL